MSRPAGPSPFVKPGASVLAGVSLGALLLGAVIPVLFVHERWHRIGEIGPLTLNASDIVIGAVALAAAIVALRGGARGRIAPVGRLAAATACFSAWVVLSMIAGEVQTAGYDLGNAAVTAVTFTGYAAVGVGVLVFVRSPAEISWIVKVVVVWSVLAAAVAVAQFVGVDIFGAWPAGRRQPSFLGHHDLASLGGIAAGVAAATALVPGTASRRLGLTAGVAAAVTLVLSGAVAACGGLAVGLALALLATWRPSMRAFVPVGALLGVVVVGVFLLRSGDLGDFGRFVGSEPSEVSASSENVETYSQRTVLVYLGLRMFRDDPLLGVGWQHSNAPAASAPYLDDARRRFPDVAEEGLPTREHPFGIQNAYVQALADMGVGGLVLFLAILASGLSIAWRAARDPAPFTRWVGVMTLAGTGVVAGVWAAEGLVAGLALDTTMWLLFGLAAAGNAVGDRHAAG